MTVVAAPPRRGIAAWSLRRRVGRAFIAILVLLVVLLGTVLFALIDFQRKGDDVINRWQPAYTLTQDLLGDLVNQETGVRGYALGRQDALLQPYTEYLAEQKTNEASLRSRLDGRGDLLADLDALDKSADTWRATIAVPFIQRVQDGDRTVADDAAGPAAKAAFDAIRRAAATLTADVRVVRESAKRERVTAAVFVYIALGVTTALIFFAGMVLWRGLRTRVLEPVENLAAQSRAVATGDISEQIVPSGPPEIEGLGDDVNAMRARIVNELVRVEAARAELLVRTDDLARSNSDLEQFAYVASHDLSEPLRKVANFCQLLERQYSDQLDDKARQYIDFAVDGAKRMQVLITDLLSFSRVGRTTDEFAQVDLNGVVFRAMANLDQVISESGAQIDRGDLPTVPGDASLLTALFQNLIGNSIKYRSEDRPQLAISAERQGDHWTFTVSDNGIGIDPKYADRIFAIFQRLHLRDQYGGTGIGLALCRKITEFHGGRIWLADHVGPGATFQFTLGAVASVPFTAEATEGVR